jgi:hypothetical protein
MGRGGAQQFDLDIRFPFFEGRKLALKSVTQEYQTVNLKGIE